jgi:hypothetical protein
MVASRAGVDDWNDSRSQLGNSTYMERPGIYRAFLLRSKLFKER